MSTSYTDDIRILEGEAGNRGRGAFALIRLFVLDGAVRDADYETIGCPTAMRCTEWVCRWARGKDLGFLPVLEAEDLRSVLGGLPLGKEFFADLVVEALRNALGESHGS